MKDIKTILDEYEKSPDSRVWDRIASELDTVQSAPRGFRNRRVIIWSSVAAISALLVSGIMLFALKSKPASEELVKNETSIEEPRTETAPVAAENTAATYTEPKIAAADKTIGKEISAKKDSLKAEESDTKAKIDRKTNSEQIVLPTNSTLARQLQSDPVLKNKSGEELTYAPPIRLQIPNLFTPNGDNVNDCFVVEGLENYDHGSLVVRDRNGKTVYHSGNYKNNWDGSNLPDGLYYYELTFSFNGIENIASGKVRIIRN